MRIKRLYRVTATFGPTSTTTTTRRDYQTKAAAEHHAEVLATPNPDGMGYPMTATSVTVTASDPITWPTS